MLFLSMATGFFVAADIFSFYMFFEAMLIPLFMLIGMFGEVKKQDLIYRFFLYNLIGALLLFSATMLIYYYYGSITLQQIAEVNIKSGVGIYVWSAIFLAFISRIPIWPFHYWISSINSGIRNPLAFVIASFMPISGIYGFIRFLPPSFSADVNNYIVWINIIGAITMVFIALIGFINRDTQYKIFSYVTIYNIMYLLGVLTNDNIIEYNIGYSLFSFIIIVASLSVINSYIYHKEQETESESRGFLCRAKRLSLVYSFMIIAAIGLPVSAIFINNFLILSKLLGANLEIGSLLIFAILIVGATLLQELIRLKTNNVNCKLGKNDDISTWQFIFMLFVIFVLVMSFLNPLWFVINE
ncbi:MAG: hypothetical protein IKL33_02900 [Alphaproteobacteria bacterium]|nr:hypothetical protein [Alphaproteobacteria bacterium]